MSCLYFPGSTVWCNPVSLFPQVCAVSTTLMTMCDLHLPKQRYLRELTVYCANLIPASAAASASTPSSSVIGRLATWNHVVRSLWTCPCLSHVVNCAVTVSWVGVADIAREQIVLNLMPKCVKKMGWGGGYSKRQQSVFNLMLNCVNCSNREHRE